MTRGCWDFPHKEGATNPSEELESPGIIRAASRSRPWAVRPNHSFTVAAEQILGLSGAGSKLHAGEDAARPG